MCRDDGDAAVKFGFLVFAKFALWMKKESRFREIRRLFCSFQLILSLLFLSRINNPKKNDSGLDFFISCYIYYSKKISVALLPSKRQQQTREMTVAGTAFRSYSGVFIPSSRNQAADESACANIVSASRARTACPRLTLRRTASPCSNICASFPQNRFPQIPSECGYIAFRFPVCGSPQQPLHQHRGVYPLVGFFFVCTQ